MACVGIYSRRGDKGNRKRYDKEQEKNICLVSYILPKFFADIFVLNCDLMPRRFTAAVKRPARITNNTKPDTRLCVDMLVVDLSVFMSSHLMPTSALGCIIIITSQDVPRGKG